MNTHLVEQQPYRTKNECLANSSRKDIYTDKNMKVYIPQCVPP